MPIPKSRSDLVEQISHSFAKLQADLELVEKKVAPIRCVDDWTIKDLLAVRVWWTTHVTDWIEAGKKGECPALPATGYGWHQTPALNQEVVDRSHPQTLQEIVEQLEQAFHRVMNLVHELSDQELLEVGAFEWAGNYPVSRWISINTTRQYSTARTLIRKALRED